MASTSSSASNSQNCPRWKYDVFLSFRGEDTRRTFTGHLYEGLKNRGIFSFQDDKRLEHGDSISEELLKAIEESQVALVVFSKNYATSSWCLNELVKIMECKKDEIGQTVIPVFYDLDPSHVRYQRESFAEAFTKHESRYKDDVDGMQKVQGWRTALSDAADLKGCDIRDRIESECIRDIVDQISSKLYKTSLSYLQDIVGINTHLEKVTYLLEMEINDVRIVGIWGMGGVGKTTIARAIFDSLSSKFDDACFLADIKENKHGMHSMQNLLLSELFREKDNYVKNKEDGKNMIARRLRFKKVLVVLDDIDHEDHLDYLAGDLGWFGNGSRIIATTRDKHLIGKNDVVYEVTTLPDHDAIKLFNKYAFKEEARDECFEELASEVVSHAKGLPLALRVWGSFLHKRDITEWRSAVDRIKKNSGSKIVENLKISYDGLENEEQEIFLDIACFLRGEEKDEVTKILESCDFEVGIGLHVLIDKSLVFISEKNTIEMHDLIQDMGKYVVNMQKDPTKRSRLWDAKDFSEEMINNTGAMAMEAIWLRDDEQICINKEAMENMKRLRILRKRDYSSRILRIRDYSSIDSDDIPNDSIESLSNNLRWVVWIGYPWVSLPEKFEPKRLVHLNLQESWLHDLWKKRKYLPYLRWIDLSCSLNLMQTPDFTGMPNLEYLDLNECRSLEEVHPSLGYCKKIIDLDLSDCESLKRFPYVSGESLEDLDLRDCSSLEKFPEILKHEIPNLKHLYLYGCMSLEEVHPSLGYCKKLIHLDLSYCKSLKRFPSISGESLEYLSLRDCSSLEKFPEILEHEMPNLKHLNLYGCESLEEVPPSLGYCKKLILLDSSYCKSLKRFPSVSGESLEVLILRDCSSLEKFPEILKREMPNLKHLDLYGCVSLEEVHPSLGYCKKLIHLDLSYCKSLKRFPSVSGESLEVLILRDCSSLEKFPEILKREMPNLKHLDLYGCVSLEEVHPSLGYCKKLIHLDLSYCKSLKRFPSVSGESLEVLILRDCSSLEKFPEILEHEMPNLKRLDLYGCESLEEVPPSLGYCKKLIRLDLSYCKSLKRFPSVSGESLEVLILRDCSSLEKFPEILEREMPNLKRLDLYGCVSLEVVHPSLGYCKKLIHLDLSCCKSLKRFSSVSGESLEYLSLRDCSSLEKFPEILKCEMPNLKRLNLYGCESLEEVPPSLGYCKKLLLLDLSYCKSLKRFLSVSGESLEVLILRDCSSLEKFPEILKHEMPNLKRLNLYGCESLEEVHPFTGESLEYLDLRDCSSLEKFPQILKRMKPELKIHIRPSGIREFPSCSFQHQAHLTEIDLSCMRKLVALPSSIGMLKGLVKLDVSECSKLESLPEEIGDLENLKELHASYTLISRPPPSIVRLNKLKYLSFARDKSEDGVYFVFPQVNEGLLSLEHLILSYCNMINGGLPEDIGCLSSLKELYLSGNNFEHLPRSIAQLGALRSLNLSHCEKLKELPDFMGMQNLETLNLSYCNLIDGGLLEDIRCLSSLKHFLLP